MKYLIFVLALMFSFSAGAYSGNDFQSFSNEGKSFYTYGVQDVLLITMLIGTIPNIICYPDTSTRGQAYEIVKKFIDNNPKEWHRAASALILEALSEGFPCKTEEK